MDLEVYVSPTETNGARCGDRRRDLAWKGSCKLRQRSRFLFLGGQHIHAVLLVAVTSQRREKHPDSIGGAEPVGEGGHYSMSP